MLLAAAASRPGLRARAFLPWPCPFLAPSGAEGAPTFWLGPTSKRSSRSPGCTVTAFSSSRWISMLPGTNGGSLSDACSQREPLYSFRGVKRTGGAVSVPGTQGGPSVLADVRFSKQRRPVCGEHLFSDAERAAAVASKTEAAVGDTT